MVDSRTQNFARSLAAAAVDVLVLEAPPGYGKSSLARVYASALGPAYECWLSAESDEASRLILDALVGTEGLRGARFAVDRLARRGGSAAAHARETLRREWVSAATEDVLVLHDFSGALATRAGADLLGELLVTKPAKRRLVLSIRKPLPPGTVGNLPIRGTTTLTRSDLALTLPEVGDIAGRAGLPRPKAAEIYSLTRGWPLVTRLLVQQLQADSQDPVLDAVRTLPHDTMLAFAAHRLIAQLDDRLRDTLAVASFFAEAHYLDLIRILGPECDDAVFARMSVLPFVSQEGDGVAVHCEVARLLRDRFASIVEPLYERTLDVLCRAGRHLVAARMALDRGDGLRAAEVIDSAPPFTTLPVPLGEYERIIERVEPRLITRFPNLWIATIPYRSFSIDPATYIREAETVYFCLPAGTDPDQRAAALMMLASAYANVGRSRDAEVLLAEAFEGFASADGSPRASLLNFFASLRGIEGRFTEARGLAEQAARASRDTFGQNQTLHYIDAHEAAFRGRQDRLVVILDELMHRRARADPPLYLAYVAENGAFFSWANGDDAAFERYQTAFEDSITPAIEHALATLIDAARGRAAPSDDERVWPLIAAFANLYWMANAPTHEVAVRAASAAVRAADQRGAPYTQTLAHVALYVLDEATRAQQAAALMEIVRNVESEELRQAVRGVIEGGPAGMLEPFVRRRVRRQRTRSGPRLVVELLAGRVTVDGAAARLREKEFELVALLASTRGALSREQIGEALWEHLDPDEWSNNLKVTLYRVRKALTTRDVTVTEGTRYRLAPSIDVDLRRGEALLRDLGPTIRDEAARATLADVLRSFQDGVLERYERFGWSHTLVARLNDLACGCGLSLASDALERDAVDDAVEYASRVRDLDPLNEKACGITIRALKTRGADDAARREFQRYAEALEREFAAVPSAALLELVVHGA